MKLKLIEISNIKKALEILGQERLTIAYEIAKNIRLCNKVLEETQELVKDIQLRYADKDENGQMIQELDETQRPTFKITDPAERQKYILELSKLEVEEHEIDFVKIPLSKLRNEKLTAEVLFPLLDLILTDN